MKRKFEANVAAEIPKTKSNEPLLPWKLTDEDVGSIGGSEDLKSAMSGSPPLKTRAPFLILLVLAIFGITSYLVAASVGDNERMRKVMAKSQGELSQARLNMTKMSAEKEYVDKNTSQLEKKISDLTAQKQLFTNVIESLTKKGEEVDTASAVSILTSPVQVPAQSKAKQ